MTGKNSFECLSAYPFWKHSYVKIYRIKQRLLFLRGKLRFTDLLKHNNLISANVIKNFELWYRVGNNCC